jgi:phage tail protein X
MLSRYTTDLQISSTQNGIRYYNTALTNSITQDAFQFKVVTQDGDRFDSLATRYYKDASKWWIIAKANGYVNGTVFIPGGIELIIPSAGLL